MRCRAGQLVSGASQSVVVDDSNQLLTSAELGTQIPEVVGNRSAAVGFAPDVCSQALSCGSLCAEHSALWQRDLGTDGIEELEGEIASLSNNCSWLAPWVFRSRSSARTRGLPPSALIAEIHEAVHKATQVIDNGHP